MLKELVARAALVLFIIGLTAKIAHDGKISDGDNERPLNSSDTSGEP
jgi:hypothetical protein